MDAKGLLSLVHDASMAVLADIGKRPGRGPFSRKQFDKRELEDAQRYLSHAESLCRIIDKVPDRRDRMAAYSALSHIIYGTFVIAQSGIYPLKEKERSFVLQAATLRARRRTKTVDRHKFLHSTIGEAEKHGKLPTKRLLENVNKQLEAIGKKSISIGTLYRLLKQRKT
jgi:hypothetical protein